MVGQEVGITVTSGSVVILEGTLWGSGAWANRTNWGGMGTIITGTVNVFGDPDFVNPDAGDYHIGANSAARDAGVNAGVMTDIDGDARPDCLFDIGADEFISGAGICDKRVYLPLSMKNFLTAPAPDLIVQNIIASRSVITVVIQNIGNAPAEQSFWVDAYVAPDPPPVAVNQIWPDQNRSKQGIAWGVADPIVPIQPGQVITLTSTDAYVSRAQTFFLGSLPAGTPIYAQVDSYNMDTNYGAVLESHEILALPYNNILGPILSRADGRATLPSSALPPGNLLRDTTLPVRPVRP